jgi:hypothetical protein
MALWPTLVRIPPACACAHIDLCAANATFVHRSYIAYVIGVVFCAVILYNVKYSVQFEQWRGVFTQPYAISYRLYPIMIWVSYRLEPIPQWYLKYQILD